MSVCKVLKTSNAHALATYLEGRDGDRAAHYMSNAGSPRAWAHQAHQVAQVYGREIEAQHLIVSFSKDDVDPTNQQQREDAMMAVWDLLDQLAPAAEKLAIAHDDAEGGHFHVHAAVANHDQETGNRLRGMSTHWQIKPVHDRVMKEYGFSVPEPGMTWADKRPSVARRKDDPVFTVALGDKIAEVLAETMVTNFEEYRQELEKQGVTVTAKDKDGVVGVTYKMYNEGKGRETRRSASKLAKEFGWKDIHEVFEMNREFVADMEKEEQHGVDQGNEAQAPRGDEETPPAGGRRGAEEERSTSSGGDAGGGTAGQHTAEEDPAIAALRRIRERAAEREREERRPAARRSQEPAKHLQEPATGEKPQRVDGGEPSAPAADAAAGTRHRSADTGRGEQDRGRRTTGTTSGRASTPALAATKSTDAAADKIVADQMTGVPPSMATTGPKKTQLDPRLVRRMKKSTNRSTTRENGPSY